MTQEPAVRCGGPFRACRTLRSIAVATLACASLAAASRPAQAAVGDSIVAQGRHSTVAVYHVPGAKRAEFTFRRPAAGVPVVFLVRRIRRGWDEVYLPKRPNGSLGWVKDSSVTLLRDPYRVNVSLADHTLTVWRGARRIHREAVGVGRLVTPTPTGRYFLVELFAQSDPSGIYGPYAFGTSAFSNALFSFGGGPGQIGLHGTNDPSALGTDVSHGCIRMSNSGIAKLARLLPLGTPITISQ
jgi:lipoprotein-anchoring transpeptidase ErfK/SrfK